MEKLLKVGVISSTHGLKGEVKVFPTTDDVKRFRQLKEVLLDAGDEKPVLQIEQVKFFKQFVILKFKGIDDIERCHEVKANHIGENHEHSVYNAQLSVVKHAFNVVGRAAVTASVFGAALVNLGQRAFEEGRRAA